MEHLVKDDLWSNHDNKIYLAQKDSQNAYVSIPDHPPFLTTWILSRTMQLD